jgi:signal transduction histidine kinase
MNVRAKLLLSQSIGLVLFAAVIAAAIAAALRLEHQVRRAELAYEQRQTITMLVAQAFRYKIVIDEFRAAGAEEDRDVTLARDEVRSSIKRLARQTEEEMSFLDEAERAEESEDVERIGEFEARFAEIAALTDRMAKAVHADSLAEARDAAERIERLFREDIARALADGVIDEEQEVIEVDAETAAFADRLVALMIGAGLIAMAVSAGAGFWLHRSIYRPMGRLMAGVQAVQGGSLGARVEIAGADEFARLARQFNIMAEALEDRERRLLGAQAHLEQQVAERTSALDAANKRLSYLDRQRLRFLADVSHELRTPVTIMRGEAEVTLRGRSTTPETYREALQRIVEYAGRMSRLIDDLLFLVRSESDSVAFEMAPVDLRDLVSEAVREGNVLARSKKLTVTESLPATPVWVEADRQRLQQAVLIAVDNAIKYSNVRAAIEVTLSAGGGTAEIAVLDRGIGISPEELPYLFERFYRIGGAGERQSGGTGLGLPIAKWIVQKHGGTISIASTPGESTKLTMTLPQLNDGRK